jgi:nucleoid DNA-binding protein
LRATTKTSDLIERVPASARTEKSIAEKAVEAILAGIVESMNSGEEVNLPGFGQVQDQAGSSATRPQPADRRDNRGRRLEKDDLRSFQAGQGRSCGVMGDVSSITSPLSPVAIWAREASAALRMMRAAIKDQRRLHIERRYRKGS